MPYDPAKEGERRKEENKATRDRLNLLRRFDKETIKAAMREIEAEEDADKPKPKAKPKPDGKDRASDSWPF